MEFFVHLFANPAITAAFMGMVVKIAVDMLRKLFTSLDGNADTPYKVVVQLLVLVCSSLAAAGDLYLKHQLATLDPQVLVNFLVVVLPTYLAAMGFHGFWEKNAKPALMTIKAKLNDR